MLHRGLRAAGRAARRTRRRSSMKIAVTKRVRREREEEPGSRTPRRFDDGDQEHARATAQLVTAQRPHGRCEREDAGRDRDRDCQHVVGRAARRRRRGSAACRDSPSRRRTPRRSSRRRERSGDTRHDDREQHRDRERDRKPRCAASPTPRRARRVLPRSRTRPTRAGRTRSGSASDFGRSVSSARRAHRPPDDDSLQARATAARLSCLGHRAPSVRRRCHAPNIAAHPWCTRREGREPSRTSRSTSSTPRGVTGRRVVQARREFEN